MYFKEDTHQYFIEDREYISFSALKKIVEPKKDWDSIAIAYAKKNKLTVEEVKKKWEEEGNTSRERGTALHLYKEGVDITLGARNIPTLEGIKNIKPLENLEDGIHLELPLYNNEYQVCGTADRVVIETIDGVRYVDIEDYKTNKKIDIASYMDQRTKQFEMLEFPLNHIMNCNFFTYSLQMSTYAYFLERYNFVPRNLTLIHVKLEECEEAEKIISANNTFYKIAEEEKYTCPYLKKEVIALLKHYKSLRKKGKL